MSKESSILFHSTHNNTFSARIPKFNDQFYIKIKKCDLPVPAPALNNTMSTVKCKNAKENRNQYQFYEIKYKCVQGSSADHLKYQKE